jgi:hypothetical protein
MSHGIAITDFASSFEWERGVGDHEIPAGSPVAIT